MNENKTRNKIINTHSLVKAGIKWTEHNNGLHFTVYNATGGKIIQIQSYDKARDKTTSSLYIINDKEDLGEELALIITKESLSR